MNNSRVYNFENKSVIYLCVIQIQFIICTFPQHNYLLNFGNKLRL